MATTKISTDVIDLSGNTEALTIPKGNTGPNTTDTTGTCNYPTTASALYQFEDNFVDTCNSSGNGTGINTPTFSNGKFGKAIVFNGTTQGMNIPSILPANSTNDSSFTGWFKTSDTSGNQQTLINAWNGSSTANNGGWAVFKDLGNVLRLGSYYLTGSALGIDGTTNVADGNWHFIAVVFDYSAGTLSLYLDGNSTPEVQISSLTPGTVNIFNGGAELGYQNPGGPFRYFPGSMDQCRIFPSALSQTQITELYNETNITSTGARPSSPTEGLMRENTTTGKMEFYDGSLWQEINDTANSYSPVLIPSANFNVVLNTSPSTSQSIAAGFTPDAVWIKGYNIGSGNPTSWGQYDTVRGSGESLQSDNQGAEYDYSGHPSGDLAMDFTSTGYDTPPVVNNNINNSSDDYVSYFWKGGGAAVTNNVGSISSQVSANTDAGFSIVKYTGNGSAGATIAHGLGGSPEIVFSKSLDSTYDWNVFSSSLSTNYMMKLNTNGAAFDGSAGTNGGAYTVSNTLLTIVSGVSTQNNNNASGDDFIAYCWRSIPGYSKIGFYVGNGSTTGPIVYTGFKPAWLMVKRTDTTANWKILDNKRNTTNPRNSVLYPNLDNAEYTNAIENVDFLTTGFQLGNNDSSWNGLGGTFIYMAFSE